MAPPWLFSAESDAKVPPSPGETGKTPVGGGRVSASHWGAYPPPAVLVHFVCAAWPGSGGRMAAMELWGKWYASDMAEQLAPRSGRGRGAVAVAARSSPSFDARQWMRLCGLACAFADCTVRRLRKGQAGLALSPCAQWSLDQQPGDLLADFLSTRHHMGGRPSAADAQLAREVRAGASSARQAAQAFTSLVRRRAGVKPDWAAAADSVGTTHPEGLVAYRCLPFTHE